MNISYNWLKEYVDFDLTPEEVAAALTSIGLETGSVEEVQTIKGGLEGLIIGEVLTCIPHPNSDHRIHRQYTSVFPCHKSSGHDQIIYVPHHPT